MSYTKEEIAKERARRNRLKAGVDSKTEPEINEDKSGGFGKFAKSLGAGAIQGVVNTGISGINALSNFHYGKNHFLRQQGGDPTIPHLDLGKHLGEDESKGAVLAGELLAPGGLYAKGIQKLNKIPTAFKGIPGFAEKMARNAGAGYVFGEQQNEEGDSYGRGISAALSAAIPAGFSLTKGAIGKKVMDTFNKEAQELKAGYKNLFETAKEKGVDVTKSVLTQNDIQEWVKDIPKNYRKSIERYFNDPSLMNTQKAQSDMGKYAADLKHSKDLNGHLPDELERRMEKLNSTREQMKKEISSALFANKSTSGLGWKYMDLTDQFREKLGPYLDVSDINKAVAGKVSPRDLTKSLQSKGGHEFRQKKGHEHPEIEINRVLNKYLLNRYGAGAIGGSGYGIYSLLDSIDKGK